MKLIITLLILLQSSITFSQWTRVQQLPASNIFTLFHKDSVFYAGGTNRIYVSPNKGQTWDSTAAIPGFSPFTSIIDHIIVYKNDLYASSPSKHIFKSQDGGTNWQEISAGIDTLASVTDFCEYKGDLYAATEGNFGSPIFKLDPVSRNHWLSFSNGLSSISTVINCMAATSSTLVAGTNNNSLYDYLPPNSTTWEERFLISPPIVNEGIFDIVTGHDTLFLAGKTGFFYMSTDNGFNWNFIGNRLVTGATFIVNAKQALISSRYIFTGVNTTLFYYIKKDSLQFPFHNFSTVSNHFTWKLDIVDNKLWDASDGGLFYMSLSDLPGISAPEDSIPATLPVRFTLFNVSCKGNQILINWKTAQEQNSNRFVIERSSNGSNWSEIGTLPAAGNGSNETSYHFTDKNPGLNNFYRIAEHDFDGRIQYTTVLQSACNMITNFSVAPNPARENLFLDISSPVETAATISIFDSKGALIKKNEVTLMQGNNQVGVDTRSMSKGAYSLCVIWRKDNTKKVTQFLIQ